MVHIAEMVTDPAGSRGQNSICVDNRVEVIIGMMARPQVNATLDRVLIMRLPYKLMVNHSHSWLPVCGPPADTV